MSMLGAWKGSGLVLPDGMCAREMIGSRMDGWMDGWHGTEVIYMGIYTLEYSTYESGIMFNQVESDVSCPLVTIEDRYSPLNI